MRQVVKVWALFLICCSLNVQHCFSQTYSYSPQTPNKDFKYRDACKTYLMEKVRMGAYQDITILSSAPYKLPNGGTFAALKCKLTGTHINTIETAAPVPILTPSGWVYPTKFKKEVETREERRYAVITDKNGVPLNAFEIPEKIVIK